MTVRSLPDANKCDSPGAGKLELGIRFALWAMQLRRCPTTFDIETVFQCSRATAYRWRRAWIVARGVPA
jgi:hypothetical protein